MLMWIILQVRKRRSDVATRQSNGFFFVVVQSRHQVGVGKKKTAGHSKVNVTHKPVCVCISKTGKKRNQQICIRELQLWPQSVWLR